MGLNFSCCIWLGRWFVVQTLNEDDDKIEQDIRDMRTLLDEESADAEPAI